MVKKKTSKERWTYEETLGFLFNQLPMFQRIGKAAYKANLNNTLRLDEYFGFPHKSFKTLHIAGTNGKGSVAHMLASVLQEAGIKTGLYTSPHLKEFTERIRVNGEVVAKEYVVSFVEDHKQIIESLKPSFFELTVAMAFDYFRKKEVKIAVIETGLGGRLDSTNIIQPEISIITNIGHDHSEFLGSDLSDIAVEKAGIIKSGIPVVVGETQEEVKEVFLERALERGSEIYFADQNFIVDYSLGTMDGKQKMKVLNAGQLLYEGLECDLLGTYQLKNIVTVLQSLEILSGKGILIRNDEIFMGLAKVQENTGLLGRWQVLNSSPFTVCDTAHNLEGIKEVLKQVKNTAYRKLHIVLGMVEGKEEERILALFPEEAEYYFTQAKIPRALPVEKLAAAARQVGLKGEVIEGVQEAYMQARANAGSDDMIFIGGSTFVVAEVL